MKNTALLCILALLLLTSGCTGSKPISECGEDEVLIMHSPEVVARAQEAASLQVEDKAKNKELFLIKCSMCHPLSRVIDASKKYDDWLMTLYSMKNRYCAQISEEEVFIIAGYINETYSG